jgi:hypothetical protein
MFSETDIINVLDFLIDNICVMFGGCVFQQIVGIPMVIYIAERETKGSGQLLFVFLEKPLYEVYLIRINEQVDEKRSSLDP